jgi:eukaryotic-like serine/threonine-protein kinase
MTTFSSRLERAMQMTLLVFILAATAFLSAITAMRIAIRGRIVSMPNVTGQPLTTAARTLGAKRLHVRVADRLYDATPANTVIRQSPAPGQEIKAQQDAEVVLSLGPQEVTIPTLEGQPQRLARIALLQAGLQLGEVSVAYFPASLPSSEADMVMQQYPSPGSKAASPRVDLLVSAGPPPTSYVMPSVIGMQQQDADRLLSSAGFHNIKHTDITQADAAKGTVIGQTPPLGEKIGGDVTVELGVAE